VPDWAVRAVGGAGGVVGMVLSTQLLGGETIDDFVEAAELAIELAGPGGVAIGSDMDGGLRMVVDAAGLPLLTDGLLTAGIGPEIVRGMLGLNALRLLRPVLGGGGVAESLLLGEAAGRR
jgi:membrane dipeptidase